MTPSLPRVDAWLLRACLPRAERDELLAGLAEEYVERVAADGEPAARHWMRRQTLSSIPALLSWSWWRGRTDFESRANAFRPGDHMLSSWISDARYAVRRLRARPGFSLLSVLTLALGIGGTAAVYGIARPLLIDPLPYPNAREVGVFWFDGSWTEQEFSYFRGRFPGFRLVGAYRPGDVTMKNGESPLRLVPGIGTTSELFDVLGARPMLGRGLQRGDDVKGAEPVAIISYGLWQELGGTPSVVGSRVTIDGAPRTVVGVMPRGFWFPDPATRIWVPWEIDPERQNGSWTLVGRTAQGVDVHQMDAHLKQLTRLMGERFKYSVDWDKTRNPVVTPIREKMIGPMRPALAATFVAMGLILLIACANVAALMLGQVEGRSTELAVRSALGANRRRLTQQLVVEALALGVVAGLAGAVLAAVGFKMLVGALPLGAWGENAAFDWTMFLVALLIGIVAVLLVVLVPSVSLWRGSLRGAMSLARTGGIQGRGGRLERGLVVLEVALAMLIASGAALLVRSVSNLYAIDPGVETNGIAVVDVVASNDLTPSVRRQQLLELVRALGTMPGVKSAAAALKLPLTGKGNSFGLTIDGRPDLPDSWSYFRTVTSGWFTTMGITLKEGRLFNASETVTGEIPVIINETLAKRSFPKVSPIGRIVRGGFDAPQRVIGVVRDVAEGDLTDQAESVRYYPGNDMGWLGSNASIVIRTTRPGDAATILESARRTVQKTAPAFAVQGTTTMTRVFDRAVGPARQVMSLLTLLSALALVLGAVGIYGVVSHFATRRKRDWAIRVALGLPASRVVTTIVGQGTALVVGGIVVGAIGAVALGRLLASFLYGVGAVDPLAFAAASGALIVVGVIAAFVPARRAGTVDPAKVLREQ